MSRLLFILLVLLMCACEKAEYRYAKVLKVGGCNRRGYCGVETDEGFSSAYLPVEGQVIKVRVK